MPSSARGVTSSQRGRGSGRARGGGRGRGNGKSRAPSTQPSRPSTGASYHSSATSSKRPSSHWQSERPAKRASLPNRQRRRQSVSRAPSATPSPPPQPQNVHQHDAEEAFEHIIMAIDCKDRGTLGCAYYVAREQQLLCMEDLPKGDGETLERLKLDIQPTHVLISTRANAKLECPTNAADQDETALPLPYECELRPNPEFSYEDAQNKLASLETLRNDKSIRFLIPGEDEDFSENVRPDELGLTERQGHLMHISGFLDLDSKVSIGCVGALIAFLHRKRASEYLQNDPEAQAAYKISNISMFSFHNTMFVNADTLAALQIITPETHPNVFNQGPGTTGSKESLSVFGLFLHHASTPQGRAQLRQIFLRPSLDVELIESRLNFVSTFVRPDNSTLTERLSKSLSKVKNLRNTMTMLRRGVEAGKKYGSFKSGVWSTLLEFCYYAIEIVDTLHEVIGAANLLLCVQVTEILDKFKLKHIGKIVFDVVDLELSQEQHRTVVKRGVDDNLDQIKNVYDGMEELLSQVAVDVARGMPLDLDCRINVIFFPQLGFHITVPLNPTTMQPLWSGNGEWERTFTTSNTAYFKEEKTRRMDQELGDLWASICDVEIEIVHNLAQQVLIDQDMLIAASDILGELDALLALAHGAAQHHLTRPRFVEQNVIHITGGRHILQELVVPSYVPNDTALRGGSVSDLDNTPPEYHDFPRMIILTGPNLSGKSIYTTSTAICVYLAQCGCFVPAETCTLGITDKILTRISCTETVSKPSSAFLIDLQQVALALNAATERSLLVLDEVGKGTETCDGAGICAGVLQYLLELGDEQGGPKVLAATHFHEIFELGLLMDEKMGVAHMHMEVRVDEQSEQTTHDDVRSPTIASGSGNPTEEVVTYLHQLAPGRSTLSYGAQCAAMNGVPAEIVARAVELGGVLAKGGDLVSLCSGLGGLEMRELLVAERVGKKLLLADFGEGARDAEGEVEGEAEADEMDVRGVLEEILAGFEIDEEGGPEADADAEGRSGSGSGSSSGWDEASGNDGTGE